MSFMTIEEAWGELPVRHSLPPESSSLTYDEMNELPGYNYARCETNTKDIATYLPEKRKEKKEKKKEKILDDEDKTIIPKTIKKRNININNIPIELINASLYIISGIYIIYIMDMFTRIGISI